jgi:hypothetical protein
LIVSAEVCLILRHGLIVHLGLLPPISVLPDQAGGGSNARPDRRALTRVASYRTPDRAHGRSTRGTTGNGHAGILISVVCGRRLVG